MAVVATLTGALLAASHVTVMLARRIHRRDPVLYRPFITLGAVTAAVITH